MYCAAGSSPTQHLVEVREPGRDAGERARARHRALEVFGDNGREVHAARDTPGRDPPLEGVEVRAHLGDRHLGRFGLLDDVLEVDLGDAAAARGVPEAVHERRRGLRVGDQLPDHRLERGDLRRGPAVGAELRHHEIDRGRDARRAGAGARAGSSERRRR
jgi:hypothetical protein